jgi:hypothetical protein
MGFIIPTHVGDEDFATEVKETGTGDYNSVVGVHFSGLG